MDPEQAAKVQPVTVDLKHGKRAVIQPLRQSDSEALATFYARVPLRDKRFYYPHPLDREQALKKAASAGSPFFVCLTMFVAGEIVGYAWYTWESAESEASGFGICVLPEFQEVGAGTCLMRRLLELAECIGPPRMHLTVQKANTRALRLYHRMGFRVVREGVRQALLGFPEEPQYWMVRDTRAEDAPAR